MSAVADALKGLRIGAKEIAAKTRLPLPRIQAILNGESATLTELRAISAGLRVPLHVLAKGKRAGDYPPSLKPLFRNTNKSDADYDITIEKVASFVEAALEILPSRDKLPAWLESLSPTEESYGAADLLAKECRQSLYPDRQEEPATDLPEVLGAMEGMVVSRLLYSRYEGVSLIAGNYCFIFISPRFQGRMLFTLGHELGHVLAHHRVGGSALFERASQIGGFGAGSRKEAFVDAFSSCFLLPDVGVAKALRSFRSYYEIASDVLTDFEILLLSRFYGTSFEVAAKRCEDLGFIPSGSAFALTDRIKKEFGSPEKRAGDLSVPERLPIRVPPLSGQLAESVSRKINIGEVSLGWATDRLGLSIGEVLAAHARPEIV